MPSFLVLSCCFFFGKFHFPMLFFRLLAFWFVSTKRTKKTNFLEIFNIFRFFLCFIQNICQKFLCELFFLYIVSCSSVASVQFDIWFSWQWITIQSIRFYYHLHIKIMPIQKKIFAIYLKFSFETKKCITLFTLIYLFEWK